MARRHQQVVSAVVLVCLGMLAVGCAALQPMPARRSPYRSALLNADFTSAYPRATAADPFGLALASSEQGERADRTQVATARIDDVEPEIPSGRTPSGWTAPPDDGFYDPHLAAQYVIAVYQANDTPTHNDSSSGDVDIVDIYRYVQRSGTVYHSTRPAVGDLVFFHNTYDRNGDGRANDWYTHIGVVESVDEEGSIGVLSYLDHRVSRIYLNLESPETTRTPEGQVTNTAMRHQSPDDPPYTQYLASELFAGFGSLLGDRNEFLVIDNWRPGMNVARAD